MTADLCPDATNLDCDCACLNDADADGICDEDEIDGVPTLRLATTTLRPTDDNGSCTYPSADNVDCDGNCLNDADTDGICDEDEVAGCTDATACNYERHRHG